MKIALENPVVNVSSADAVIVVPCFNEFQRLDVNAFRTFAEQRSNLTFLLVNDGSTDRTPQLIEQLRSMAPRSFATMHLPGNFGKAEAVRRGMQQAFSRGATYAGFWDADLATPLEMIDVFCRALSGRPKIEMVFGTRLVLLGHRIQRSVFRGLLGRAFAVVASLLLGTRIRDTQCGAKLFRSSPITRSLFQQPFLSRWIFDVEIISRLVNAGRHFELPHLKDMIYECPLDEWREISGGSIKGRDFYRAIADLAAIYWRYLRPGAAIFPVSYDDRSSRPDDVEAIKRDKERHPRRARAA
jgi:glycosyltransferase involved in cell wall biosynthesis